MIVVELELSEDCCCYYQCGGIQYDGYILLFVGLCGIQFVVIKGDKNYLWDGGLSQGVIVVVYYFYMVVVGWIKWVKMVIDFQCWLWFVKLVLVGLFVNC